MALRFQGRYFQLSVIEMGSLVHLAVHVLKIQRVDSKVNVVVEGVAPLRCLVEYWSVLIKSVGKLDHCRLCQRKGGPLPGRGSALAQPRGRICRLGLYIAGCGMGMNHNVFEQSMAHSSD